MSKNFQKFNYTKWGSFLGISLALILPTIASSLPSAPPKLTPITNELHCQKMYGTSASKYDKLITVGKRTEEPRSRFVVSASKPRSVTCKIIKNSGEIKLAYGLPDNSKLTHVSVKIYVDGVLRKNLDFGRGQAIRESLDVKNASGYTIDFEVVPKNAYFSDYVYNLLPKS
jgi:hypothetical protein